MNEREVTLADKIDSLKRAALYRPLSTAGIVVFSFAAALLEGIGLTFLVPVIEIAQAGPQAAQDAEGIVGMFAQAYALLGVPFTIEWMLVGLGVVMTVRYSSSFAVKWLRAKIQYEYMRSLRTRAFEHALTAEISYYDREGSDELLNAIITQTRNAGLVLRRIIEFFQQILLSLMYLSIALVLAPVLTVLAAVLLGGITFLIRYVIEPGYTVGDRIASANERLQTNIQAGTQGIRDIKLFGMIDEVFDEYRGAIDTYTNARIGLARNTAAINSFYELTVALLLFVMIYAALTILDLSFAALGVFLFAMFRLAPRVSNLNSKFYNIEGDLPHLVRTHWFIDELTANTEDIGAGRDVPNTIETVRFENVSFSYETGDEQVLRDISFGFERGEFIGFVGQSGAGKSTIVSLLVRMYEPDSGEITANGTPIDDYSLSEWRDKIAMVRQKPFIFNETLRFNLTIGNRDASQAEIERIADIAKITEFLDELPNGYDSKLGDEGIQLSGGQRQRVALARALLTDAEILVLDEATSDLDSNLEQQVHAAIEALEDEYTILAIAHQLSTVRNADRIYTVEAGRITEAGTHDELVETGGKYAELYAIQS
jgi:subfamily B ATP-binding cassette protein MsbA